MASRREQEIDHILRRAGFGATQEEVDIYARLAFGGTTLALARLLSYKQIDDDVDDNIGKPGYVGDHRARRVPARRRTSTTRASAGCSAWCTPSVRCRRRWRSSGTTTSPPATRRSRASSAPTEGDAGAGGEAVRGSRRRQGPDRAVREHALGNFRDLLVAVAQDPAMLVWLDGRTNVRGAAAGELRPRADGALHDGRRHYAETDVYAGARVFTGWNLARPRQRRRAATTRSTTTPAQHETTAKKFTFPIYPDGGKTIPARVGGGGHAGRPRSDQRRRRAIRRPGRGWRASCTASSSTRSTRRMPALIDQMARRVLRQRLRDRSR